MLVYGLDFTSAPTASTSNAMQQKRLTLAKCQLEDQKLWVQEFETLNGPKSNDFSKFRRWLETPGPWIAGLDFPFAMPAKLTEELNWPQAWDDYVQFLANLGKQGFIELLSEYKASKPSGQKELRRVCDRLAGSISPMKLFGVPVAKMFYAGAPLLREANVGIPFLRPRNSNRIAIETYPALVARKFIGRTPYKTDNPKRDSNEMKKVRHRLIKIIAGTQPATHETTLLDPYGLSVAMPTKLQQQCIDDPTGDLLDSVLCAIQAAWAWRQRDANFGCQYEVDYREGWIFDPEVNDKATNQDFNDRNG